MDIEKVIKSLKYFRDRDSWREGIMIHDDHAEVRKRICDNAIALLKEQEHKDKMFHALEDDWKRLKGMLKEQEAEIRQLRLALDIAKGTCKGIIADRR